MAAWKLTCRALCVVLCCVLFRLTEGFQWHSTETLIVHGCVGSKSTIPWQFSKHSNESIGTIHWFRFARETVASLVDGQITNPDKRFLPSGANAEMTITGLTPRDTGYYEVEVKVFTKNVKGEQTELIHTASALLNVGDPPSISGEALVVQEVSSSEACALQRQVTLRCGHFISLGLPPLEVVWTDPAGQQLPSSRYAKGKFDLDLPHRPLAGNYTCHVQCQNPVLQCLEPQSPLLAFSRLHLQPSSFDGCSDAAIKEHEKLSDSEPQDSQAVQRLQSNLTELRQLLNTLRDDQANLQGETEARDEHFFVKMTELRELVLLSNQQSSGAQMHVLQQTLATLQNALHDLQQNLTALQKSRGGGKEDGEQKREPDSGLQDVLNIVEGLNLKLEANDQAVKSVEDKVTSLSAELSKIQLMFSAIQEGLTSPAEKPSSEGHALNVSELWNNLNRLEELHGYSLKELKNVSEAQRTCEKLRENVTQSLRAMASRVDGVEQGLSKRVDRAVRQWDASRFELGKLDWRLRKVERGEGQSSAMGEEREVESSIDPLLSMAEPTISVVSPWDERSSSLFHDFVITPDGQIVIADRYHASVIIAPNTSSSDVTIRPLRYGSFIRRLTHMQHGVVAATVNDRYLLILHTIASDHDSGAQQRWIRTSYPYHGIAARSAQTLFVGADKTEAGGEARVDIVSIVDDVASVVSTVMSGSVTPELKKPAGLTVHDDELYVSDWDSGVILRLSLQTLQVSVLPGPGVAPSGQPSPPPPLPAQPRFFQPRDAVFDVSGNMYVTTGGRMCGAGRALGAGGFCVVVVSREGWWARLIYRGHFVYPYGLALTSTGLAVSWGSAASDPARSLIQWYDLVPSTI